MADNVPITPGAGQNIAADDVASVFYQKIKVDAGEDGISVPVIAGRQADAASVPVALSTEDVALLGNAIGVTTDAAVVTDANGTIQQYLRGLVKLFITAGSALVTAIGNIAHDTADSGAPVKVGGRAINAE